MINQGIKRLTISGLCQWYKGQKIQITTEDISPVLNFYATQDRDDGTILQFKLDAPPYGVGTTFKLDIPNKMLEEANTITIYGQEGESVSRELECQAIITLPVVERPKPEDLPVPTDVNINLLYSAIGEVIDIENRAEFGGYGLEFAGQSIASDPLTSLKIQFKEGASPVEITKLNQPLLHFDLYNYDLVITYGENLEGLLEAVGTTKAGQVYKMDIIGTETKKSAVVGFTNNTYKSMKILGSFNASPDKIQSYTKYFNKSKICGAFSRLATDCYPFLMSNI